MVPLPDKRVNEIPHLFRYLISSFASVNRHPPGASNGILSSLTQLVSNAMEKLAHTKLHFLRLIPLLSKPAPFSSDLWGDIEKDDQVRRR
jgi:hypothetical protein